MSDSANVIASVQNVLTSTYVIESISDMIEIISNPKVFLKNILDIEETIDHQADIIGKNHTCFPRPFPHGIWFRGQSNSQFNPIPQLFREGIFYEEADMFQNIKLSHSSNDYRGFNNFELMCIMQHHRLPTRLLDWSENILIAAFFAIEPNFRELLKEKSPDDFNPSAKPAAIYALNAFRLNSISNIAAIKNAGIAIPYDIDVMIRSLMVEHTYSESVFSKILNTDLINRDRASVDLFEKIRKYISVKPPSLVDPDVEAKIKQVIDRMRMPIAVIPRRDHPRMDAQLSTFTLHGGKKYFDPAHFVDDEMHGTLMEPTINLVELNEISMRQNPRFGQFMMKFEISKFAVKRIMIELDRLGIKEPMIYPDIENQSEYVKRRWSIANNIPRKIVNLPQLGSLLIDSREVSLERKADKRIPADSGNFRKNLYNK